MKEKMKKEMKALVQILNEASKAYYSGRESGMSDKEYDTVYDELLRLETETGIVLPDSPTQKVGYEVVTELPKVQHAYPALSLDKTKDREFLQNWLHGKDGTLSWKLDGLTAVATWEDGELVSLVTRGNGYVGEDVTHNARFIKGLPMKINETGTFVVRGEVVISYKDFRAINATISNPEDKYMNPRNLASASLRLMDSKVAATRHMHFLAFNLVACEDKPRLMFQCLHRMKIRGIDIVPSLYIAEGESLPWSDYEWELGEYGPRYAVEETSDAYDDPFIIVDQKENEDASTRYYVTKEGFVNSNVTFDSEEEAEIYADEASKEALFPYPTDGLVLTYNDLSYGESLGMTGKYPKNAIAFKWADVTEETTLRDVEWSASRSGLLNPVAVFDPVELEGTMVSRASLHNISYVKKLSLGYNDTVTVYKANMIIPQLDENLTMNGNEVKIPTVCPVCGQTTVRRYNEDGTTEFLYCVNEECPAKHVGRFTRLVERDGLNIRGISKATIEELVSLGMLKEFADIYDLERYKEQIISLEGFGEKSFDKMIRSIEQSKNTTFRQFFYALGIPGAGHDVAKTLEHYLDMPEIGLENLMRSEHAIEQLVLLDGIGMVTAKAIVAWFTDHMYEYLNLRRRLNFIRESSIVSNTLEDVTVVITGNTVIYDNRNALKKAIEERGGKVSGSVSKKTSYLVNNDVESTSGKNKKAKELGVPIISEADFADKFLS